MYNRRDKMHNNGQQVPGIINLGKGFYFVTDISFDNSRSKRGDNDERDNPLTLSFF